MATTTEGELPAAGSCEAEQATNKPIKEKKHHLIIIISKEDTSVFLPRIRQKFFKRNVPSVCVLKEPYLIDCCGNSFCRTCIEPIKNESKLCPLCNIQFTTCIPDKRLQRTLNELHVYCCHKEAGCEWVGELGGLTQHLNIKPQGKADRMTGCQLAKIMCAFCSNDIERKDLKEHEEEICTKRPYNCEYCEDYKSIFEDVTTNHWPECRSRPVPCPNECGASPKLELLDDHVEKCPLQVIDCPFEYAGCKESLLRKDMPDHITQSLALHMSLQATNHQRELKKLTSRISELEATLKLRELEVKNLLQGVVNQQCKPQVGEEIKQAQQQELINHPTGMEIRENRSDTEKEILKHLKSIVHNFLAELVPFSFSMPDFEQKKSTDSSWYSTSFYTHPRGYKMCLRVEANGWKDGKNSHVSVYLYMMRGEYDESLKWPFRGDITLQLLNQLAGGVHHTRVIDVTDKSDDDFCKRVVLGERSSGGWGFHEFISHSCLVPRYLKDDCLKFCIKEVKLNN